MRQVIIILFFILLFSGSLYAQQDGVYRLANGEAVVIHCTEGNLTFGDRNPVADEGEYMIVSCESGTAHYIPVVIDDAE